MTPAAGPFQIHVWKMSGTQELQKVLDLFEQRIAAVESKVGVSAPPPPPAASTSEAPQVAAFDAYCAKSLEPFVAACAALNTKEATECAEHVKQAWSAMRGFIVAASVSKKPANFPGDCMALIKPCQEAMQGASAAIKRGDWELHQKTISEGVQCLSWLITSPGPKDVVESYIGGTDFHANKIRVKYKKTDQKQIAFCDTFKRLMTDLMAYVKEYHLTGVTFNPRGGDISSAPVATAKENTPPAAQPTAKAGLASALAGRLRRPMHSRRRRGGGAALGATTTPSIDERTRRRRESTPPPQASRTPTTSSPRACGRSRRTSRPGARSFLVVLRLSSPRKLPR